MSIHFSVHMTSHLTPPPPYCPHSGRLPARGGPRPVFRLHRGHPQGQQPHLRPDDARRPQARPRRHHRPHEGPRPVALRARGGPQDRGLEQVQPHGPPQRR